MGAAPAAGPAAASADPWLGALRRQAAEQAFDEAVLPLRNLFRDTSVALELHRDVDRMRGEMIQEPRMEVARLKGTVLSPRRGRRRRSFRRSPHAPLLPAPECFWKRGRCRKRVLMMLQYCSGLEPAANLYGEVPRGVRRVMSTLGASASWPTSCRTWNRSGRTSMSRVSQEPGVMMG